MKCQYCGKFFRNEHAWEDHMCQGKKDEIRKIVIRKYENTALLPWELVPTIEKVV